MRGKEYWDQGATKQDHILEKKKMNEQKPMASPQAEARVLISENTSYQDAVRVGTQAVTGLWLYALT